MVKKMAEYEEFVTGSVTLADATYAELQILFPQIRGPFAQSNNRQVPMVIIHNIDFDWEIDSLMSTAFDDAKAHLCKSSQADVLNLDDAGVIEVSKLTSMGVPVNTLNPIERIKKYPPVMYPYDNIYVGAKAAGTGFLRVKICYTIRMVSRNELLRTMVPQN